MEKHTGYILKITFIQNDLTVHTKGNFHKTFLKFVPFKVWLLDCKQTVIGPGGDEAYLGS